MGCTFGKNKKDIYFQDHKTHQRNQIRIQKIDTNKIDVQNHKRQESPIDQEIHLILQPIQSQTTDRSPESILKDIVKSSEQCIQCYNEHNIDRAYSMLIQIQKDIKELQCRGFKVEMNQHFKEQFIQLSHVLKAEYQDMIEFNKQISKGGWKLQKQKKNFKVSSRIQDQTVGILLQSILQVPFQNFIAVMIQPNYYKEFLPFIKKSTQQKNVRRNCKLGMIEMSLPIISNRQSYFQGVLYNRLKNERIQDQQFFMYTRSIQNRKDLQKLFKYEVKLNPKCVPFQYKYIVVKYVPLTKSSGKMIMGVNIDLKLNILPMAILEMASISFSQDFFDNIVKISKNFQGSLWDQGTKRNPQLFNFTKSVMDQYLLKNKQ